MKAHPEAVANHVVNPPSVAHGRVLQRKCACGQHTPGGEECQECKRNGGMKLQRSSLGSSSPAIAPPIVHEVLRSPGQPLDAATREFFEPRFGSDFSRVRVHSDNRAAESARAVAAAAYTVGNHLVFGDQGGSLSTGAGQRLWAHELGHVLQQDPRATHSISQPLTISNPNDASEGQADRMADSVVTDSLSGQPLMRPTATLSRQPLEPGQATKCDTVCASLESMRRAVQGVCRVAGEDDPRCINDRATYASSEAKAAKCKCPDPLKVAEAKLPAKFPSTGIRVIGGGASDLLKILGDCTGLPLTIAKDGILQQDPKGKVAKAASQTAKSKLSGLLTAPGGAIIDTDPTAPAVVVGAFSHETPGYQQIDVGNVKALASATGAKGGLSACDAVMHEISEAVAGRQLSIKPAGQSDTATFAAAHAEGTKVESGIRKDLKLPARSEKAATDFALLGKDTPLSFVVLETLVFGEGKNILTQLSVYRVVLPDAKATAGDDQVVASTVIKGEVHFKTQMEALATFNKYASQLGLKPIPVPKQGDK